MRRLVLLLAVCALLLAACAGEGGPQTAPTPAESPTGGELVDGAQEAGTAEPAEPTTEPEPGTEPEAAETTPPEDGPGTPDALAFEAPLLGGGTFTGSDHDGRDVALWFWAPW